MDPIWTQMACYFHGLLTSSGATTFVSKLPNLAVRTATCLTTNAEVCLKGKSASPSTHKIRNQVNRIASKRGFSASCKTLRSNQEWLRIWLLFV